MAIRFFLTSLYLTTLVSFTPTISAHAEARCDLEMLEIDPPNVVAPCTAIIDDTTRGVQERAFAFYVRGTVYARQFDNERAYKDFVDGYSLDNNSSNLNQAIAWILNRYGQREQAFAFAQRALEINPNGPIENYRLAALYADYNSALALQQVNRLLTLDPEDVSGRALRIEMAIQEEDIDLALSDLEWLEKTDPNTFRWKQLRVESSFNPTTLSEYSAFFRQKILLKTEKYQKLIESVDKFAIDFPESAIGFYHRAYFRKLVPSGSVEQDQYNPALDYSRAVAIDPKFHEAWHYLALSLIHNNEFDQAVDTIDQALASIDTDPMMNAGFSFLKALAERGKGNIETAVKLAQESVYIYLLNNRGSDSVYLQEIRKAGYLEQSHPANTYDDVIADAIEACMNDSECG